MSKFGRRIKSAPTGFEVIEPTLTALENELRESKHMNFYSALTLLNCVLVALEVNEPHEGMRKNESQWPIHQINWQKSRYVYDMYYTYSRISKDVYDYCITNKLVDAALIAKWKKPGYERLCSTYVINPKNFKFGTVSICRVPKHSLAPGTEIVEPTTGCRGCASGANSNIFGNKYGQFLAAIQIAREERAAARNAVLRRRLAEEEHDEEDSSSDKDETDPDEVDHVTEVDGTSKKKSNLWAENEVEENLTSESNLENDGKTTLGKRKNFA
jgi:bud site selection protein 31